MNKQELQNEINKTKEHLANMEKMLAECEYERWKPKVSQNYYYVDNVGGIQITTWRDVHFDDAYYSTFNCFQTKEQAETEAEKILVRRMLEDIARRLNKGEKIDWEDASQNKYNIYLDTKNSNIACRKDLWYMSQGQVYCSDINFLDVAIQEIGEERLKKYLRGE